MACTHDATPSADRIWERRDNFTSASLYTNDTGKECASFPVSGRRNIAAPRETAFSEPISTWLQKCNKEHQCWNGKASLPSRVLDVSISDGADDIIRLYESRGEMVPYACLSYCWGHALPLKTTRDTYEDRQRGITFGQLPRALQDAVTVTRALGIQYLWIDALCIMQDSLEDWEVESSNMAAIYRSAYAVIAADISKDCDTPFLPRTRPDGPQRERALVEVSEPDGSTFVIYGRENNGWGHQQPLRNTGFADPVGFRPLGARAWALQEEVLASRIIHFTPNELFWQCQSSVFCECTDLDGKVANEEFNPRLWFKRCLESEDPNKTLRYWKRLMNNYMSRSISQGMDRLPALSGMVKALSDVEHLGRYNAGLWSAHLPFALLWTGRGTTRRMVPYRAPSWSCFSLETLREPYPTGLPSVDKAYATVHEVECTVSGKDPYGAISSGRLRLTAPLLQISQHRNEDSANEANTKLSSRPSDHDDEKPSYGRNSCISYKPKDYNFGKLHSFNKFDFQLDIPADEPLFWLLLGGGGKIHWHGPVDNGLEHMPQRVEGLILRRQDDHSLDIHDRIFERVGSFELYDSGYAYKDHDACFQLLKALDGRENRTVTIV